MISIETLVLVAIWEKPFIFQGAFTITNKGNLSKKLLIFRCKCEIESEMFITEKDFSPISYQFTHLCNSQAELPLSNENFKQDIALYLLKYALNETLKKIIIHPKQHEVHMDDIAIASISRQMENYLFYRQEKILEDINIGFAVTIDFTPAEELAQKAALSLLELASISLQ